MPRADAYHYPMTSLSQYCFQSPHRIDDGKQNVIRADDTERSKGTRYIVRFAAATLPMKGQPVVRIMSEVSLPGTVYFQLPSNQLRLSTLKSCLEIFLQLHRDSEEANEVQWLMRNISSKTIDAAKDRELE